MNSKARNRSFRTALIALGVWHLTTCLASAETSIAASPTPAATPAPQSLAEIPRQYEELQDLHRQLQRQLAVDAASIDLDAELDDIESTALPELERQATGVTDEPKLADLLDLETAARNLDLRLTARIDALEADVRRAEKALDDLAARGQTWGQLAAAAADAQAPQASHARIDEAQQVIASLVEVVRARRDRILEHLDHAVDLHTRTNDLRDGLSQEITAIQRDTLASASQPLWSIPRQDPRSGLDAVRRSLGGDLQRLADYGTATWVRIAPVFGVTLIAGLIASLTLRRKRLGSGPIEEDQGAEDLSPVLAHPFAAAILLALIAVKLFAPSGPLVISHLLWALMSLPAALLAASILGRAAYLPIALVTASVLLWPFQAHLEAVPLLDRLLLLAETAAALVAVLLIVRRGLIAQRLTGGWRTAAWWFLRAEATLLTVAFIAATFGDLGLARILRNGAIASLGMAMILYGAARALLRIVGDILRGPVGANLRMVREHPEAALRLLRRSVVAVTLAAWVWLSLDAFQLTRPLEAAVEAFLRAGIEVGWFDLTVAEALAFFGAIVAAFLIAKVVCFVLDEEFLPRLPLSRGVPYMISTAVRYLILVAGFTLALAALGVDLSKATILAGAFGVGIGFGLQNVVNNFVSGLILLFERPIRVGDVIEIAGVLGEVTRIGIRSSTVKTFVGSEVIVPNGELISKDVTNWTLSNRHRRVEVLVGAAYGSDPKSVLEALERVATDHHEVMADPRPSAFLVSFGDSQLDFKLVCWVARFSDGYRVASELRVAVARAFAEAGIEIPFPQQDLRVRSGTDGQFLPTANAKTDSDTEEQD